ncbi:hypothetical protein COCSUDRAFT_60804 [Coccomyxa subellipsoidea C-169]|uniref:Uncharacterized protein n=1 Tax=Coccomyxa subellipsoidea (strain C-169) TaxID=574566 RepID=I0Z572_COCSC|nr:hypothetical protein COCSUDRAFT_60804 [Coccomyxa subellipsoidea C-169]EIE25791.1 hypothetical protein COCSUDRAFT_60804 [Coccomyxa subellipsoidea C-169]|eukprot:XP_005650335.1 hypothetical protein COCSUDRAFT_60804 [Coccomyxa subellipsoidea C-169]
MPATGNALPESGEIVEDDVALADLRASLKQLLQENKHLKAEVEDVRRLNSWAAELLDPAPDLIDAEPTVIPDQPMAPPSPTPAQPRPILKRVRQT